MDVILKRASVIEDILSLGSDEVWLNALSNKDLKNEFIASGLFVDYYPNNDEDDLRIV